MAYVVSDDDGQMMLLAGLSIAIGVVVYTTLLNNIVYTANMPSTGLDISKQDIRELRTLTESGIRNAARFSNNYAGNETEKQSYFLAYAGSFNNITGKMYSTRGASVEVILNNVTANRAATNLTIKYYNSRISYDDTFTIYYP